jgi:hypothetical protein
MGVTSKKKGEMSAILEARGERVKQEALERW